MSCRTSKRQAGAEGGVEAGGVDAGAVDAVVAVGQVGDSTAEASALAEVTGRSSGNDKRTWQANIREDRMARPMYYVF